MAHQRTRHPLPLPWHRSGNGQAGKPPVEKRLGVSYPTVRAKLDEVIGRLAGPDAPRASEPPATDRRSILEAVARGELSPPEAAQQLRMQGGTQS